MLTNLTNCNTRDSDDLHQSNTLIEVSQARKKTTRQARKKTTRQAHTASDFHQRKNLAWFYPNHKVKG